MIFVDSNEVRNMYDWISDTVKIADGLNLVCGKGTSFGYSMHGMNLLTLSSDFVASDLVYVISRVRVNEENVAAFELSNPDATYVGNRFMVNDSVYATITVIKKDTALHTHLHKFGISLGFVDLTSNSMSLVVYTNHCESVVVCGVEIKTTKNKFGFIDVLIITDGGVENRVHLDRAFKNKDVFLNLDDYEKYRHNAELESGSIRVEKDIREMEEMNLRKDKMRNMEMEISKKEHEYKIEQYKEKDKMKMIEMENSKKEHEYKIEQYKNEIRENDEMRKIKDANEEAQKSRIIDLEFILDIRKRRKDDKELMIEVQDSEKEIESLDRRLTYNKTINVLKEEDTFNNYEHTIGARKAKNLFNEINNTLEFEEIVANEENLEEMRKLKALREHARHKHAIGEILTDIEYKNIEDAYERFHARGDGDDENSLGETLRDGIAGIITKGLFG